MLDYVLIFRACIRKCRKASDKGKAASLPGYISLGVDTLPDLARASIPAGGWSGFALLPSDAEIALGVPYQVFINSKENPNEQMAVATIFHELAHCAEWENLSTVGHESQTFKDFRKICNKYLQALGYEKISKADFSNI